MKKHEKKASKIRRAVLIIALAAATVFAGYTCVYRYLDDKATKASNAKWKEYYEWRAKMGKHFPHITSMSDFEKAVKENELVILQISSAGCGPCTTAYKKIYEMHNDGELDSVKYYYVDLKYLYDSDVGEVVKSNGLKMTGIPFILFFRKGELLKYRTGDNPELKEILRGWIKEAMQK